jgi:hypothetical protein
MHAHHFLHKGVGVHYGGCAEYYVVTFRFNFVMNYAVVCRIVRIYFSCDKIIMKITINILTMIPDKVTCSRLFIVWWVYGVILRFIFAAYMVVFLSLISGVL